MSGCDPNLELKLLVRNSGTNKEIDFVEFYKFINFFIRLLVVTLNKIHSNHSFQFICQRNRKKKKLNFKTRIPSHSFNDCTRVAHINSRYKITRFSTRERKILGKVWNKKTRKYPMKNQTRITCRVQKLKKKKKIRCARTCARRKSSLGA